MNKKPILPIMVDLETLSTKSNAAVIEIALVPFSLREDLGHFTALINMNDSAAYEEFSIDQDTVDFHEKTSDILTASSASPVGVVGAGVDAFYYLSNLAQTYEIHLWARGKDFDIPILTNFLRTVNTPEMPWDFWNTHCLRDLAKLYSEVKAPATNTHRALADAINQVNHIRKLAAFCPRAHKFIWGE